MGRPWYSIALEEYALLGWKYQRDTGNKGKEEKKIGSHMWSLFCIVSAEPLGCDQVCSRSLGYSSLGKVWRLFDPIVDNLSILVVIDPKQPAISRCAYSCFIRNRTVAFRGY